MANNPDVLLTPEVVDILLKIAKEEKLNYSLHSGVGNKQQKIITTDYLQTENEVIIKGKTNSLIILGADRPAGINSGQGGVGHTACAAIDLIAGHSGRRPIRDINGVVQKTSKNFDIDSARVYISQYCDLDEYFGIPKSFIGGGEFKLNIQESQARSGVGIKADVVRVVGRENIKIVTSHVNASSVGQSVNKGGIDIMAGYDSTSKDTDLQPMVKGNNLKVFLEILTSAIIDIQSNLSTFIEHQTSINNILKTHRHPTYFGSTYEPVENAKISALAFKIEDSKKDHIKVNVKSELSKNEFFSPTSINYINSKFNRVN